MKQWFALALLTAALASPLHADTVYVPFATDEIVGSVRYRTQIGVYNASESPAQVRTLFVSADGVRHPGHRTTVPAHGSSLLKASPAGAHGHVEVTGPAAVTVSASLMAFADDGRLLSSEMEPVLSAERLAVAAQTINLYRIPPGLPSFIAADSVLRSGIVTAGPLGSCSVAAYLTDVEVGHISVTGAAALSHDLVEPLQALQAASPYEAGSPVDEHKLYQPRIEVTCDTPAYAYAAVLTTDGSRTAFLDSSTFREEEPWIPCCFDGDLSEETIEALSMDRNLGDNTPPSNPDAPPRRRP